MGFLKKKNKCLCDNKDLEHKIKWMCENVPLFSNACREGDEEKMEVIRAEIESIMEPLPEEYQYRKPDVNIEELNDLQLTDQIIIALNKRGYYANGGRDNIDNRSEGLGDSIAKVLSMFGVTEERFEKLLGGGGGCGCGGRKDFLNRILPYKNAQKDEE